MPERLGTVFQQNHPVHEVLVLDDCSTDESLNVIPQVATEWGRTITLLPNTVNSGSVFAQWRKAAEMAKGEFVWIAEADDLSDPTFLSTVIAAMQSDERIGLGFSDSRSINLDGSPLWDSYKGYYSQQEPGALSRSEIFEGVDFIRHYLAVRNLILNVSAVVWRRETLLRALEVCRDELKDFRMAGDWRLYIEALSQPGARLAYIAEPLNVHRRHAESVTHALKAAKHIAEIATCHNLVKAKVKLPASIQSMQKKYLDEVSTQLQGPQKKLAKKTATALKNPKRSKRNSG
jgi:glycosyltransferase involved in cell wall biosynthesis